MARMIVPQEDEQELGMAQSQNVELGGDGVYYLDDSVDCFDFSKHDTHSRNLQAELLCDYGDYFFAEDCAVASDTGSPGSSADHAASPPRLAYLRRSLHQGSVRHSTGRLLSLIHI